MKKYLFIVLLVGIWSCEDEDSNEIGISDDFRRCGVISETIINPYDDDISPTIIWDGKIKYEFYQRNDEWVDTMIYHYDNYGNPIKVINTHYQNYSDTTKYTYIDFWKLIRVATYSINSPSYPNPMSIENFSWNGLIMTDENGQQTVFNEYGNRLQDSEWAGGAVYTYLEDKRRLKSVIRTGVYTREYTWDGLSYEMTETLNFNNVSSTYYGKVNEYGQIVESENSGENTRYYTYEYDCELFDPIPN